jgi:hypothetical protein
MKRLTLTFISVNLAALHLSLFGLLPSGYVGGIGTSITGVSVLTVTWQFVRKDIKNTLT